jgi:hypothetical protein
MTSRFRNLSTEYTKKGRVSELDKVRINLALPDPEKGNVQINLISDYKHGFNAT